MSFSRRDFIKTTAIAGMSAYASSALLGREPGDQKVRIGFIGVGSRGRMHVALAARRPDVEVVALCDIQQVMIDRSLQVLNEAGRPKPQVILEGPYGYRKLLADPTIDAVVISTPWEWHTPQCLEAMNAGKYTACEVITGTTLEECWQLVHTSERTGMPLMMLENVCYRRDVMAIMNMVRQNLFGELIHLQGGYQHDLRAIKLNDGTPNAGVGAEFNERGFSEAQWRTRHAVHRNGDLYPTHSVGPIAMMTNINRGNRFTELVSYSSKARGLHNYITKVGGKDHPNAKVEFKLGDVVTTMLRTANDETFLLQHDTGLPRPYSLGFRVQGTKGIWMDVNHSLALEDLTPGTHEWTDAKEFLEKYDHPLWKKYQAEAAGAGHGGMDWFVFNAFVETVKRRTTPPMDVYDAVTWSAIVPLSETSIRLGGESVDFPDFTRGAWMQRPQTFALDDSY